MSGNKEQIDVSLIGNDKIEEAIVNIQKEPTEENLVRALSIVRHRMNDKGQLIEEKRGDDDGSRLSRLHAVFGEVVDLEGLPAGGKRRDVVVILPQQNRLHTELKAPFPRRSPGHEGEFPHLQQNSHRERDDGKSVSYTHLTLPTKLEV